MHGGGASIRSNEGMSGDRPRKQGSESIFPTAGLARGCLPRPAGLPGACRAPQLRLDGRAEPVHLLLALVSGGVHSGEHGNATSAKLENVTNQWLGSVTRQETAHRVELVAPDLNNEVS